MEKVAARRSGKKKGNILKIAICKPLFVISNPTCDFFFKKK